MKRKHKTKLNLAQLISTTVSVAIHHWGRKSNLGTHRHTQTQRQCWDL